MGHSQCQAMREALADRLLLSPRSTGAFAEAHGKCSQAKKRELVSASDREDAQSEQSLSTAALISLLASPDLQDQLEGRDRVIVGWLATQDVFRETLGNLKSSLDRPASARVVHNLVEIANEAEAKNPSLEANYHWLTDSPGQPIERHAECAVRRRDLHTTLRFGSKSKLAPTHVGHRWRLRGR